MGNFASCTLARTAGAGSGRGARAVLPDGQVRQVALPATAAELMLEAPGHFLADARALLPGRRIDALPADEELQRGVLYAALPMKRLGAPAAPADLARLAAMVVACGEKEKARTRRRMSASSPAATAKVAAVVAPPRVLEAAAASVAVEDDAPRPRAPKLEEMAVDDAAAAAEIEELKQRLSGGGRRSRRPTLETIQEESYAPARC
ncbi:uncharacterized protein LOC133908502 [Phragmites australis]|uniref:uncharacterized protein LOC133908502 n=1 Tax=Phragmites australis TaxID=29695 RepID=UPI002D76BFCA|nr:uncharacterized protein LOC133908502 [Phragmites australis]